MMSIDAKGVIIQENIFDTHPNSNSHFCSSGKIHITQCTVKIPSLLDPMHINMSVTKRILNLH